MKNLYLLCLLILLCCACFNKKSTSGKITSNPDYKRALQFRDEKNVDSAFYYFNQAKDVFLQVGDSLGVGKCLINMALISTDHGDNFGGIELSLSAIPYFNSDSDKHFVYIKSNFNNLGIASYQLKQYHKAIEFYHKTLVYTQDSLAALVTQNNLANAYRQLGDYKTSLSIYHLILEHEMMPGDYARVLSNEAYTQWLLNPKVPVTAGLLKALHIRERELDGYGMSASYGYLTDVYLQSKPDSAAYYAKKMNQLTQELNLPDERLEALQKLVKLSEPESAQRYFDTYQHLVDSLRTARSAAKNQFALIRYETEKHKAEKLKFQTESNRKQFWIYSLLALFVLIVVVAVFWYHKRRERIAMETQHAIQENQLKTSKKVHDVVANGLYRIMSEIENVEVLQREQLLDHMEVLYEQSRDISYEQEEKSSDFPNVIKRLLSDFATKKTRVVIVGNSPEFWKQVPVHCQQQLQQVLLELMVNMKKHSRASQVAIKFEQQAGHIHIYYSDNGLGLNEGVNFGNGLRNTGNRINEIGGKLNFENGAKGGLKIHIQFALPN